MYIDTREVVSDLVPKYANGKTLDIGGGTSKYRSMIVPNVSEYVVSDITPAPGVDVVTDARALSFADETFDTVISFQLLEHVDDTGAVLHEMNRVLKKGGVTIFTAPFMCAQHGHPSDFHRFTLEGMKWYFEKEGFAVLESGTQGSSLSVISEVVRFSLLNPYRNHGKIRTAFVRRLCLFLKWMDRKGFLRNPDLYTNTYVVARKI